MGKRGNKKLLKITDNTISHRGFLYFSEDREVVKRGRDKGYE
jgi:hypothetical protein